MDKLVKVLFVLDYINHISGVSAIVMNYYLHLDPNRISCDFLLFEDAVSDLKETLNQRGSRVYVAGAPSVEGLAAYQGYVERFFREHKGEYDIVHVHAPATAFVVLKSAKKYGVPTRIIHSHNTSGADGMIKKIRNFIVSKWGIHYSNCYYACSIAAGEYLFGREMMKTGRVSVMENAIDLEKYRFSPENRKKIRAELGIEKQELLLGHIGRFVEQKNHAGLLDIFAEVLKAGIPAKLLLIGTGELWQAAEEKAKTLGIFSKIIFAGMTDHAEEYFSAMDVFLLPSLYEGLPVVCVEAQAAGLPCLVSENVTKEINLTGRIDFFDNKDYKHWCDKIRAIEKETITDSEKKRMEITGLERFDIKKQAKKLEENYLAYGAGTNSDVHV